MPKVTTVAVVTAPTTTTVVSTLVSASLTNTPSTDGFVNPDNGNIPDRPQHPVAFPSALGFGRITSARATNAVVYKINTLTDVANPTDGLISYRECALALAVTTPYAIPSGRPRYCVFDVAGAISLQSPARITVPKLYIAGQTSPGGVEFRLGANYNPVDSLIDTRRGGNDVIVRYIRARLGDHLGRTSDNGDPIRLQLVKNQILDHVSTMFGTDESLDMQCQNCTVQWSVIGPNICKNAGHSSSLHCKTFFLKPAGNVTIAHNISQHGEQRGMNASIGLHPAVAGTATQGDVINNVLYNYITETGLLSNQFGSVYANYEGNVAFRGPLYNGQDGNYFPALYYSAANTLPFGWNVYMKDNATFRTRVAGQFGQTVTDPAVTAAGVIKGTVLSGLCGVNASGVKDCTVSSGMDVVQEVSPAIAPMNLSLIKWNGLVTKPEQAMKDALAFAGADLCRDGNCRDNVDAMFVDDIRTCDVAPIMFATGWTSTVAQTGGFAVIPETYSPLADADNDGMPDSWEQQFASTNPNVWDANADADGDGYPNIEEYLNYLAQENVRYTLAGTGTGSVPAYNCGRAKL